MNPAEVLCVQWSIEHRFLQDNIDESKVLIVRYDDLVADPEREFERMARHCGLSSSESTRRLRKLGPAVTAPSRSTNLKTGVTARAKGFAQDAVDSDRLLEIVQAYGNPFGLVREDH